MRWCLGGGGGCEGAGPVSSAGMGTLDRRHRWLLAGMFFRKYGVKPECEVMDFSPAAPRGKRRGEREEWMSRWVAWGEAEVRE